MAGSCTTGGVARMEAMGTQTNLYEQDFYLWIQEQATTLGAREFEALDIPHLIEEMRDLGNNLKSHLPIIWPDEYRRARRKAQRQTGLPLTTFPATCPWDVAQVLDEDFWPEAEETRD